MKNVTGSNNTILEINLSTKEAFSFHVKEEDLKLYLGGKGLGLKYLSERMQPGTDPLGEENYLAVMMGIMLGTGAPCSARFSAVTKSPLTGIMVSSSCGGPFGMAFKTAGFDGLLITGRCEKPAYLIIDDQEVRFEDASHLWGMDTEETQSALNLDKDSGALAIGPAGENQVLFANIASGHRYLGRGGMGAVMGSKNLKAIVAKGKTHKFIPHDKEKFTKTVKQANTYIKNNHFVGGLYKNMGTSANVTICNQGNILPVRNFSQGSDENAVKVSGEYMAETYKTQPNSCKACPVRCGHKGTYKDGSVHQIPEYETIGLLGTNLGVFDADKITQWNDLCGKMGVDTISTGSVIAWAMEAGEKGLINTGLAFGNPDGVSQIITDIAHRKDLGNDLADGTRRISEKLGGTEFAIQVKGLEMAAYDPRGSWGQGLAYAVANRGACHLSATTMALEVFLGFLNPKTARSKAVYVRFFENLFAAVNSLHTCQFAVFAYVLEPPIVKYTPKPLLGLTMQFMPQVATQLIFIHVLTKFFHAITGIRLSQKQLMQAGERIHILERYLNTQEGISRKDDRLPDRMINEKRPHSTDNTPIPLDKMLDDYYKLRGYDAQGIPKTETLEKLGIVISPKSFEPSRKPFKTTVNP